MLSGPTPSCDGCKDCNLSVKTVKTASPEPHACLRTHRPLRRPNAGTIYGPLCTSSEGGRGRKALTRCLRRCFRSRSGRSRAGTTPDRGAAALAMTSQSPPKCEMRRSRPSRARHYLCAVCRPLSCDLTHGARAARHGAGPFAWNEAATAPHAEGPGHQATARIPIATRVPHVSSPELSLGQLTSLVDRQICRAYGVRWMT